MRRILSLLPVLCFALVACREPETSAVELETLLREASFVAICSGKSISDNEIAVVCSSPAVPVFSRSLDGAPKVGDVVQTGWSRERSSSDLTLVSFFHRPKGDPSVLLTVPVNEGIVMGVTSSGKPVSLDELLAIIQEQRGQGNG